MIKKQLFIFFAQFACLSGSWVCFAQDKRDTVKILIQDRKITKEIVGSITRKPSNDTTFTIKSEDTFLPYEGKVIRRINIEHLGFEKSFYNGTKKVRKAIVDAGNSLHRDTRERIIRNNLFIRENKPLNPYKVADNERYLRDLEFILDARIVVNPVPDTDSVDLTVITRDVFSLGGSANPNTATEYEFKVYDANLLGLGQRLQFSGLIKDNRDPVFGPEFLYTKNSVGGSLANLGLGYTTINTGSSFGNESESAYFLRMNRPLVSPYTRMTGGMEWSYNWSNNVARKPDSLFLRYSYNVYDLWVGYNIGIHNNFKNRNRHVVTVRYFNQDFKNTPRQEFVRADPLYSDNNFLLGNVTFFKQNFYKTRFVYGFGRTEDVPYGHNAHIAGGWSKQFNIRRPYFDAGFGKKVANRSGDFYEADIRAATFLRNGKMEDATTLFSLSWYSRLMQWPSLKIRQYVKGSFTTLTNRVTSPLLNINNEFGVRGFSTDSLRGNTRVGFTTETVFYTKWKLLGFHFAPITFADVAFLSKANEPVFSNSPYLGIGAGIRTRNENVIFGTVDLKVTFYPKTEEGLSHFRIALLTNLRLKYTASFVRLPGFMRPNQLY